MNTILKRKTADFIEKSGISKSLFASRVELSYVSLQEWLKDRRILSRNAENRIELYMNENVERLKSIING